MKSCGFQFDNTYARLSDQLYTKLKPEPVEAPKFVIFNDELASELGLDFSSLSEEELVSLFAGNTVPENSTPFAQAYAGHQFGHFTMLGDGRAIIWGEHITPDGQRIDIQFKGSGRTPYSRRGDGRAALGPMLREYIIGEAMHALGVPTTRSLAVVTTGESVFRETALQGAILTRTASSHIRVGTFEYIAALQDKQLLSRFVDYTIDRHFPEHKEAGNKALELLKGVCERQADLMTHWMRTGFIHGVMNTDNMTISGETIDYGPCAFMDAYDPGTVFSSIDHAGRYAFGNQPLIAQWNLARFAETLLTLLDDDMQKAIDQAEIIVNQFSDLYTDRYLTMMRKKLGLFSAEEGDDRLINDLLGWMQKSHADYTNTFLALRHRLVSQDDTVKVKGGEDQRSTPCATRGGTAESIQNLLKTMDQDQDFQLWFDRWMARLEGNAKPLKSSICIMGATNPAIIPRNHLVEQALRAGEKGDMQPFHDLLGALQNPYDHGTDKSRYQSPPASSDRVYQTFCGT